MMLEVKKKGLNKKDEKEEEEEEIFNVCAYDV